MTLKDVDFGILNKVRGALLSMQRLQWEQGCAAQAFLEWGDMDTVAQLARSAVMRQDKDGRLGVMEKNESVDDPAAVGEALITAARQTGEAYFKAAADKMLFYLKYRAPKTIDGILYHFNMKNQVWIDEFYMAPPFLAFAGEIDEALKQARGLRKYLFNENEKLHSHIWDDDINDFGRKDFWGVGNGWAIAGLTRLIKMLPEERKDDREYLIRYVSDCIDGCLRYQREDGLYHDVLNDRNSFVDTNAGQMIAYGIYRGVAGGYIPESYLEYAEKSRLAAYGKVDAYGFVTDVCGVPDFVRASLAPEGQAFFILMEAAVNDLIKKT
jgi:unsaturated rhamnogalacturonyl hydrolase